MKLNSASFRVLAVGVIILAITIAIAAVPVGTEWNGAMKWATALTETDRLQIASDGTLARLPIEYRRAVFATLSTAEARCALWKSVFAAYRHTHSLSADQDAAMRAAESLLTPALFTSLLRGDRAKSVRSAGDAIASALGRAAAIELFRTAGPQGADASALPITERILLTWRSHQPRQLVAWMEWVVPSLRASDCNCASQEDCKYFMTCGDPVQCSRTSRGCGSWWMEACTSICYYPIENG